MILLTWLAASSLTKESSRSDSPSNDTEITVMSESLSDQSEDGEDHVLPAASFWTQFRLLFKRSLVSTMRDLVSIFLN